jgi:hypothetical protein
VVRLVGLDAVGGRVQEQRQGGEQGGEDGVGGQRVLADPADRSAGQVGTTRHGG